MPAIVTTVPQSSSSDPHQMTSDAVAGLGHLHGWLTSPRGCCPVLAKRSRAYQALYSASPPPVLR
ncbi:hypothetical protein OH77DRAFT_1417859 [Trametes cingulata]|nr:hypothetical protein OH77DRAFT_1417859 [Trametes cingulata]